MANERIEEKGISDTEIALRTLGAFLGGCDFSKVLLQGTDSTNTDLYEVVGRKLARVYKGFMEELGHRP